MPVVSINGILARPAAFGLTGDLSSAPISIPRGAQTMTVFTPILKAGTTYKVESLVPPLASDQTAVWVGIFWANDDGSTNLPVLNQLSSLGSTSVAQALVLRDSHFGAGVIRFTFSAAQDAAASLTVLFGLMD